MVRAEAAFKEAEHSQDTKVREACEQKVKALRAQQQEAERLNNHCKEREVFNDSIMIQYYDSFLAYRDRKPASPSRRREFPQIPTLHKTEKNITRRTVRN
jgi:exonuclease I